MVVGFPGQRIVQKKKEAAIQCLMFPVIIAIHSQYL